MTKFPSKKELDRIRKLMEKAPASQGLPKDASPVDRAKYNLCEKFVTYRKEVGLSQRELAKKLGTDETVLSRLLHYHIEDFTTDRLIKFLSKLYPDIELDVKIRVA